MITLDSVVTSEKNKAENAPIFLYEIFDYDGNGSNLYFAEYDVDVVFNSITYQHYPITHEIVADNAAGEIENVRVSASNVSRLIQAYLEAYDWRKKKVVIRLVWANQLVDPTATLTFTYYIDSYTTTQDTAEFNLVPKIDLLDYNLPGRIYSRNYCVWKFKSTECGYTGDTTTCNKTKAACQALENFTRFGGFPSVPSRNMYV